MIERLKERRLVQWALAYLAGAWVLLQVLDVLDGNPGWPPRIFRVATALLWVGFLVMLVLLRLDARFGRLLKRMELAEYTMRYGRMARTNKNGASISAR